MNSGAATANAMSRSGRRLARGLLALAQTRLDLLWLELEEERVRWLTVLGLALGGAVFALLAIMVLTVGIMAWLWSVSPWLAVLLPLGLHGGIAVACVARIRRLIRSWELLPASVEQLRQDRECLEDWLA